MDDHQIKVCAEALISARQSRTPIEALPISPASVAEAHAIQDCQAALLPETTGAFKVNVTAEQGTTRGLIFERVVYASPALVSKRDVGRCGVEGEVAFRFLQDLPPRDAAYTRDEVAAGVAAAPTIEVVSGRYGARRPVLEQLADFIANAALVVGEPVADWAHLDLPRLKVELRVNGEVVHQAEGGHPAGDPMAFAVALVNAMRDSGGVKAGQVVTTGSWTGVRFLQPGDHCSVRFAGLGEAQVTFAD